MSFKITMHSFVASSQCDLSISNESYQFDIRNQIANDLGIRLLIMEASPRRAAAGDTPAGLLAQFRPMRVLTPGAPAQSNFRPLPVPDSWG